MSFIKRFFGQEVESVVHFGSIDNPLPDWRKETTDDEDNDNDEDAPISDDVLAIIGFDPDKQTSDK